MRFPTPYIIDMYNRILIKLSGEALGLDGRLFDFAQFDSVARSIKQVADMGVQIAVVIGAGNIWRGRSGAAANVDAVIADQMGMTATLINTLLMQDALTRAGVRVKTLTAFDIPRFADPYTQRGALAALADGCALLLAGGTGHPFFSTDTGAALRAIELSVDAILLAKNVDGVYDRDPNLDASAKFLPDLTYDDVLRMNLRVMDTAAIILCKENGVPVLRVFGLKNAQSIVKAARGESFGSVVHA
ncbi:MAG: UMP kinase [Oscillospiraceae bacterium]|jgi:uridylate kinase|nr:UMP kinase [Oscillospiraceae bacterium]